jgi:hypothetical protein
VTFLATEIFIQKSLFYNGLLILMTAKSLFLALNFGAGLRRAPSWAGESSLFKQQGAREADFFGRPAPRPAG